MKIYLKITKIVDFILLQEVIDTTINWCNANQLSVNKTKRFPMSYYRINQYIQIYYTQSPSYLIDVLKFRIWDYFSIDRFLLSFGRMTKILQIPMFWNYYTRILYTRSVKIAYWYRVHAGYIVKIEWVHRKFLHFRMTGQYAQCIDYSMNLTSLL